MLALRIALRYLFSRKSHGAVNVISAVSVGGVAVAAAAMVVVLSVFNGFSGLAESKLSRVDPDLA
ncbi:MAG: ABC transporter permease, partial [Muribaculaceae bacterium]|nr:ABC transporter permease [Muribaculaceae bacterium]